MTITMVLVVYSGVSCKILLCGVGYFRFNIDVKHI